MKKEVRMDAGTLCVLSLALHPYTMDLLFHSRVCVCVCVCVR